MSVEGQIYRLERESMKESILHSLDGRVKLIVLLFIIVYAVYTTNILILALIEIYLILLILLSRLSLKSSFIKILLIITIWRIYSYITTICTFRHNYLLFTFRNTYHVTRRYIWNTAYFKAYCDFNMYCSFIFSKSNAGSCRIFP